MKITDIDVAKAVIAHEAVDCFLGAEAPTSEQPADLVSSTGGTFWGRRGEQGQRAFCVVLASWEDSRPAS